MKKIVSILVMVVLINALSLNADATVVGEINLHQFQGAPSSDVVMSNNFNFYAQQSTTHIDIDEFYRSNNTASVVYSVSTGLKGSFESPTSFTAGGCAIGTLLNLTFVFTDYDYRTYYTYGSFKA